jgi:sugar phosphate isomerase/epimerase
VSAASFTLPVSLVVTLAVTSPVTLPVTLPMLPLVVWPLPPPPAPVPGHPIGRCVRVLGVTAPEDARRVGFEYLELALQDLLPLDDQAFAAVVTRIRAVGLPALSGYGFLPADLRVVGPDAEGPAAQANIDRHVARGLARARQLGLTMVVFGNLMGKVRQFPPGFERARAWRQLVAFSRRAAARARAEGITVLMEPLPARATNLVNTVAEGLALVNEVRHPNLALLVDFGYVTEGREDLADVQRAARHIRQVEIQNPDGRVYPRRPDEADYAAFFQALRRGGYRGGFSVHGKPARFFEDAPRAIAVLRLLAAQNL